MLWLASRLIKAKLEGTNTIQGCHADGSRRGPGRGHGRWPL
jgi:hypothetical protein